ncbi:MAG: tetratricopeptide repeat protein [Saprospiraceae bacterium]
MRYLFILLPILILACTPNVPKEEKELHKLATAYDLQPNTERAAAYLEKATEYIGANKENIELVMPILKKAANIAKVAGMHGKASGFLMAQVKESKNEVDIKNNLIDLGGILKKLNKSHASDIIFKGLLERYPNDEKVTALNIELSADIASAEGYLNYLFDQVLVNPDEYGINRQNALKYVDGTEAFALVLPNNKSTPDFLYKAAEVARSLRTMPKAMNLYDWILKKYPDHKKGPTTLFIKGFLLEQEFDQMEEAKKIYEQFLTQYPEHEMASSAKFLLNNMGKSDEEILKEIEEKRKVNPES